jgi:hypothetical protein
MSFSQQPGADEVQQKFLPVGGIYKKVYIYQRKKDQLKLVLKIAVSIIVINVILSKYY